MTTAPRHDERMPLGRVSHVRGLVLAAGAGRRMGGPKALVRPVPGGPTFVERTVELLLRGGCDGVTVVVGAAAPEVTRLVIAGGHDVDVVECPAWDEGMGASLRAGLAALSARPSAGGSHGEATEVGTAVEAVVVTLVDLPDLVPGVVRRLLAPPARELPSGWRTALRRASYGGEPGHPALVGRDHWAGVAEVAVGDRGARDYFRRHAPELIECGDLATGRDADHPADLRPDLPD